MNAHVENNREIAEILVAEDSPTQAEQLRYLLEKNGYKAIVAEDGQRALDAARARKPTLIISDVMMPVMDGYSLSKNIKDDPQLKDVPIILVTELSQPEDVIKSLECGADNFIRKPYNEKDLLKRIQYLLTNGALRKSGKFQLGIEVELRGKRHFITSERQQILDLLISMYEDAARLTENLSHSLQSLNGLYRLAEGLNTCITEDDVVRTLLDRVMELPGVSTAWLFLTDPDGAFRSAAARGLPPALCRQGALEGPCLCQRMLLEGSLLHAKNVIECERLNPEQGDTRGITCHASVPLQSGGYLIGLLNLAGEGENLFSEQELNVLYGMGNQVGLAFERARLHANLEHLLEKRTAALHESEAWFRGVFEAQEDAVFVVAPGRIIIDANPAAERILGYTLEEMKGRSTEMLHVNHDYFLRFGEKIRPAFDKGEAARFEFSLKRKNGEIFPTDHTVSQLKGPSGEMLGIVSVFRDITQRKRAEAERERLVAIVESAPDMVGMADANYRAVYLNGAGRKLLGIGLEEDITGFPILESHPEAVRPILLEEAIPTAIRAGVWSGETIMRARDGREIPVAQTIMTHKGRDGFVEFISTIARDLTEKKQAEAEKKQLEEQFHQAQRMESIGMLAGGIAHDMNNILSAVNGFTELALAELEPGTELYEDLSLVRDAGERGARLVKQILAFSRRQVLEPQALDLNRIIRDFEKMIGRLLGENIELRALLADDLSPVLVDEAQFEQVLMNLAVNARDAMPDGGVLTIETSNVYLDERYAVNHFAAAPGHYTLLTLSDSGCGMDAETQRHIFEPFFSTKEAGKGTGLGLATVYGIVKQHGGYIYVYSEPGHGTTFKIYLPACERPAEAPAAASTANAVHGSETVLIVEDDKAILELASAILTRHGYHVLQAASVEAAIQTVESYGKPIDLVLTDVIMPGMNGRQLIERLRQTRPGLKALYFSGYTHDATSRHGILEEGIAYLPKPFTVQSLLEKVRHTLQFT